MAQAASVIGRTVPRCVGADIGSCVAWLRQMHLTHVPSQFERTHNPADDFAANLVDLFARQASKVHDQTIEHPLRDVIGEQGKVFGVEPFPGRLYKG